MSGLGFLLEEVHAPTDFLAVEHNGCDKCEDVVFEISSADLFVVTAPYIGLLRVHELAHLPVASIGDFVAHPLRVPSSAIRVVSLIRIEAASAVPAAH